MARKLSVEERQERLTKEDAKQFPGAKQVKCLQALLELEDLIKVLERVQPVIAYELRETATELCKLIPLGNNAVRLAHETYPGQEERRRQRYEFWKAHYQKNHLKWMDRLSESDVKYYERKLECDLQRLKERYNSPLLEPKEEPKAQPKAPSGLSVYAYLLERMMKLLMDSDTEEPARPAQPAQTEEPEEPAPYVDPDVWGDIEDLL